MHITVIGAGAFGGWTALQLARRGTRVTLVDAWGAGHSRASSGGESRVIRATYGTRAIYTAMARRALELWRAHVPRSPEPLLHETGVLWMFGDDDSFARSSAAVLSAQGGAFDRLEVDAAKRRYPQINFSGISSVYVEPEAGYLLASRACHDVVEHLIAAGGSFRLGAAAMPVNVDELRAGRLSFVDGSIIEADGFVFACGPWLGQAFPDAIGARVIATRQDVYYFGVPAGDARFTGRELPAWVDMSDRQIYGIPAHGQTAFKFADDTSGPPIEPTSADRQPQPAGIAAARSFLLRRFPALADAPLVAAEVCQYESTPDSHFIVDRHPAAPHVWIVGGGSGHGFKMGPALGELVSALVLGDADVNPQFALARFTSTPAPGSTEKWS